MTLIAAQSTSAVELSRFSDKLPVEHIIFIGLSFRSPGAPRGATACQGPSSPLCGLSGAPELKVRYVWEPTHHHRDRVGEPHRHGPDLSRRSDPWRRCVLGGVAAITLCEHEPVFTDISHLLTHISSRVILPTDRSWRSRVRSRHSLPSSRLISRLQADGGSGLFPSSAAQAGGRRRNLPQRFVYQDS